MKAGLINYIALCIILIVANYPGYTQNSSTNHWFIGLGYGYVTPHIDWIKHKEQINSIDVISLPVIKLGFQKNQDWRISINWHYYEQMANYNPPPPDFEPYIKDVVGYRTASYLDLIYGKNITSWIFPKLKNSRFSIWGHAGIRYYGVANKVFGAKIEIGDVVNMGWHTFAPITEWYNMHKTPVIVRPVIQAQAKYMVTKWLSMDGSVSWSYTYRKFNPFVINLGFEMNLSLEKK